MDLENLTLKWKKLDTKCHVLYDSICMLIQNRQVYGDRKQASGCQGLGWGGNGEWKLNGYGISFWGDENVSN